MTGTVSEHSRLNSNLQAMMIKPKKDTITITVAIACTANGGSKPIELAIMSLAAPF